MKNKNAIIEQSCKLYTLEGVKEAFAGKPFIDSNGRMVSRITANDCSICILVLASMYERKFSIEEKPTFYAC